jgi:peptide/nickel transport system permease protein
MPRYIARRLLLAVPVMLVVSILVFLLIRAIPGDPALLLLGDVEDPGRLEAMRAALGLDKPLLVQFGIWLGDLVRGELGRSIVNGEPVARLVLTRFTVTAQIVLAATAIAALLSLPAGLLAAWRRGGALDGGVVVASTLLMSMPSFWVGILLLLVFGVQLGWLPVVGFVPITEDPWRGAAYLLLPVLALVLTEIAVITRVTRASALDVLNMDYVANARAKGLAERVVLLRHALPNAFPPALTILGLILGQLLGGAAVVETVFTLPGVGRLLVESIYARDYPVVQGCLLLIATAYVLVNLVVDLLYPLFDPRLRA